jgi:hypothetical protein
MFKNSGPERNRVASEKSGKNESAPGQFEELMRRLEQCQEDPKQLAEQLEKECQKETLKCIEDGEVALNKVLNQLGVTEEEKKNVA